MYKSKQYKYKAETWDIMQYLFGKFNDHQIHCLIQFESYIDKDRFIKAVNLLIDIYPIIKCHFVDSSVYPYWNEDNFNADDIVQLIKTANTDYEIQNLLCSKVNEFKGPQLKIYIIRDNNSDTLCLIMNHMLCDGTSFKELLYLLSSIYSNLKNNPSFKPDLKIRSRSTDELLHQFNLKEKFKIIFQKYDLSRHDNKISLNFEGNKNKPFIATHVIDRNRFLNIKYYAKQHKATINDVMLAAYLRTLSEYLPGQVTSIQCILDLRKYFLNNKANRFCNLTSNLVCNVGTDIGKTFDETLNKVKAAMDTEKKSMSCLHLIMLLETIFHIMPYKAAKRSVLWGYHNPPLAMSNIGIIDHKRLLFDNIKINNAFITGSIKYNPLFQLALSTFNNEVTLSVGFHGTQEDKKKVIKLLKKIDDEFHSLK